MMRTAPYGALLSVGATRKSPLCSSRAEPRASRPRARIRSQGRGGGRYNTKIRYLTPATYLRAGEVPAAANDHRCSVRQRLGSANPLPEIVESITTTGKRNWRWSFVDAGGATPGVPLNLVAAPVDLFPGVFFIQYSEKANMYTRCVLQALEHRCRYVRVRAKQQ